VFGSLPNTILAGKLPTSAGKLPALPRFCTTPERSALLFSVTMPNERSFKQIQGSICAPRGFEAAAVFCDIKKLGTGKGSEKGKKRDLALIVSEVPAVVAGMFTTNQVCAAPVKVSARRAAKKSARGIVVNSGNANACTGTQGLRDAEKMTQIAADAVAAVYSSRRSSAKADDRRKDSVRPAVANRRYRKITPHDVLVCSTGRIGVPMPMKNVERGIRECAPLLARTTGNARQVAGAIMTTDTRRKEIAVEFKIGKSTVRIGGICKGAGMIQPGMALAKGHATMLAFIISDVVIGPGFLKCALETAVAQSFNRITVDGDMSTNDSVIMLANGLAGNPFIGGARLRRADKLFNGSRGLSPHQHKFQEALNFVCLELAKMIVRDGEGVSRLVTLNVRGARNVHEAQSAARSVANSTLVRASWCGGDPNWGRILCALGYSNARIDEKLVDVGYASPGSRKIVFAFRRGRPTNVALKTLAQITSLREFDLCIDLHLGRFGFTMYAADLTEDYVALNKGDVSDPKTLGG
jgi:glutamate N-acetyltransferase / amino-acid N-acetyltransferase